MDTDNGRVVWIESRGEQPRRILAERRGGQWVTFSEQFLDEKDWYSIRATQDLYDAADREWAQQLNHALQV